MTLTVGSPERPEYFHWTGPPGVNPARRQVLDDTRKLFEQYGGLLGMRPWHRPSLKAFAADERVVRAQLADHSLTLRDLANAASVSMYRADLARHRYDMPYAGMKGASRSLVAAHGVLRDAIRSKVAPRNIHEAVAELERRGLPGTVHMAKGVLTSMLVDDLSNLQQRTRDKDTAAAVQWLHHVHPEWSRLAISARMLERGMPIFPKEVDEIVRDLDSCYDPDRPLRIVVREMLQADSGGSPPPWQDPAPDAKIALIVDSGYPPHDDDAGFTLKHQIAERPQDMVVVLVGAAPRDWSGRRADLEPPYLDGTVKRRCLDKLVTVAMDPLSPRTTRAVLGVLEEQSGYRKFDVISPFSAFREPLIAELRGECGVPGPRPAEVEPFDNKTIWHETVKEAGLAVWEQRVVDALDRARLRAAIFEVAKKTDRPEVIIKPERSAGNFAALNINTEGDPEQIDKKLATLEAMMLCSATPADPLNVLVCEHVGDAEAGGHGFGPEFWATTLKIMRDTAIAGHALDPRNRDRAALEEMLRKEHRRLLETLGITPERDLGDNYDIRYDAHDPHAHWWIDGNLRTGLMAPLYIGAAYQHRIHAMYLRMHMGEDVSSESAALQRQGPVAAMIYAKDFINGYIATNSVGEGAAFDAVRTWDDALGPLTDSHGKLILDPDGDPVERIFCFDWGGVNAGQRITPLDNDRYLTRERELRPARPPLLGAVGEDFEVATRTWRGGMDVMRELAGLVLDPR
jgi:hypothetical protein